MSCLPNRWQAREACHRFRAVRDHLWIPRPRRTPGTSGGGAPADYAGSTRRAAKQGGSPCPNSKMDVKRNKQAAKMEIRRSKQVVKRSKQAARECGPPHLNKSTIELWGKNASNENYTFTLNCKITWTTASNMFFRVIIKKFGE